MLGKGSVLILDNQQNEDFPLAQSTLDYIPASSDGLVKVTENHEVEVTQKEDIVHKSSQKVEFWNRYYYEVVIEGKVTIKNHKDENIDLIITNTLDGKLDGVDTKGEILYSKQPVRNPNLKTKVKYNMKLKAGATEVITYQYRMYVQ